MRGLQRGFSLLEVMVALAILVVSLAILMETLGSSALATREAERIVTATQLAQEKLAEVQLIVEKDGISESDIHESGDFSDFGDEGFNLEFGDNLDDYHFEWWVSEIDIGLAGDIASMTESLEGTGLLPDQSDESASGLADQSPDLGSLGISNKMITEMLGRYIREMRVRVWWGESSEEAERLGDEVVLIGHATDPRGSFRSLTGQEAQ